MVSEGHAASHVVRHTPPCMAHDTYNDNKYHQWVAYLLYLNSYFSVYNLGSHLKRSWLQDTVCSFHPPQLQVPLRWRFLSTSGDHGSDLLRTHMWCCLCNEEVAQWHSSQNVPPALNDGRLRLKYDLASVHLSVRGCVEWCLTQQAAWAVRMFGSVCCAPLGLGVALWGAHECPVGEEGGKFLPWYKLL